MRGSIEGGLWALVLGTAGLSVASLGADLPAGVSVVRVPDMTSPSLASASPEADAPLIAVDDGAGPPQQVAPATLQTPQPDQTFAAFENTKPPVIMAQAPPQMVAADGGGLPSLPRAAVPPVSPPSADGLRAPAAPQPPTIDVTSWAPPVATPPQATPEPAPEPQEVITAEPAAPALIAPAPSVPSALPQVDTAEAPVTATMPAPQLDDTQIAQADPEETPGNAVRINRPTAEPDEPIGQEAVVVTPEADDPSEPALSRFAAAFENEADLPVIGIVLVDDGTAALDSGALAKLGFAPTMVINALDTDAATRMAAYRAAGLEVAMQVRLPDGAQPADVEIAFAEAFRILPDVAMLYADGGGELQSNTSAVDQVMEVLNARGHGFVTVQRGLGNAARAADQAGVPAATIDRELDGNGDDAGAIARTLDQAAFRARQTGGAVLMGRLQPDTLSALEAWASTAVDDGVAPAPVSAVLLAQGD